MENRKRNVQIMTCKTEKRHSRIVFFCFYCDHVPLSYEKGGIKVQPYINSRTWYNGFKQRNKQNERVWNMNSKSKKNNIPKWAWLLISFGAAMVVWYLLSINTTTARAFQNQVVVLGSIKTMINRGVFWNDISSSLISVTAGFALGFALSLPSAILMAWYAPVRNIVEPWIQFIRNIPPLAYVPLIVMVAGVGRKPQIIVITIATFLIMTVTIYQGVINVDETLIKAARVLGATDKDIFLKVIAPATLPFIITAIRLGSSTALTTLIAAESTGAQAGLGMRIRSLNNSFESAPMLMYVILIGILGMIIEKIVKYLEKRFTGWQEKREV